MRFLWDQRCRPHDDDALHVGAVLYKPVVDVNEEGTEAGAAIAVTMTLGGRPVLRKNSVRLCLLKSLYVQDFPRFSRPFGKAMIAACSTNDAGTNWGQSGVDSGWQWLPQVDEFPNRIGLWLPWMASGGSEKRGC